MKVYYNTQLVNKKNSNSIVEFTLKINKETRGYNGNVDLLTKTDGKPI